MMPTRVEQAQAELRRRAAQDELDRREGITPTGIESVSMEVTSPQADPGMLAKVSKALTGEAPPEEIKTYRTYIGPVASIGEMIKAKKGWQVVEIEPEAAYVKQALGAFTKGGMKLGQAVLEVPKHTAWLAGNLMDLGPGGARRSFAEVAESVGAEKAAERYEDLIQQHKEGQEIIIRNHPEWESNPPESFLDLLTSPRKLSLAIEESLPVLIGAGILTAAGRPDLSMGLIYAVEGQEAADMAIAEDRSEDEAEYIYHTYGSVAAAIEQYLRINPTIKLSKGAYNRVLARSGQKLTKAGKSVGKGTALAVVQETIEEPLQGAWQDISAQSVYRKGIEGGAAGFADRRAQEAYIGAVMGLIPIAGGGAAGAAKSKLSGRKAKIGFDRQIRNETKALARMREEPIDQRISEKPLGETLDPTAEFTVEPEGVSTVEIRDDVVPQEVERAVGTERAAWDAQYGGRNVANLEEQVRFLVDQVEGEKDSKKLKVLADQMETLDTEIERIREVNIRGADIGKLHRLAKKQEIKVPKGAKRSAIVQLLQGDQDVIRTKGGYIARSLITHGPVGTAWQIEAFPTYEAAQESLLRQRAEQAIPQPDPTVEAQANEIEAQDIAPAEEEVQPEQIVTSDTAPVKQKPRTKRALRAISHKVARAAKLSDDVYRDLAEAVTGKRSMKAMSRNEMDLFVTELEETYGAAESLTKEDYEVPIRVGDDTTTVGTMMRRAREAVAVLAPKRKPKAMVKIGIGKEGLATRAKRLFFGIDNTPVFHLAKILDGGESGIYSEVLDLNMEKGRRIRDGFIRASDTYLSTSLEDAEISSADLAKMSTALNPRTRLHQFVSKGAATDIFTEEINGREFEFTWGRLLDFYLASNQETGLRHISEGGWIINEVETGAWSEEKIVELRAKVEDNPQLMSAVEAILGVGKELWQPAVNQVSQQQEGKDIATIDNWWGLEVWQPKRIKGKSKPKPSKQYEISSLIENRGIFKDRTRSTAPLIMRDAFNRYTVFNEAIAEYVGMADAARIARTLTNDPALSAALQQKGYGPVLDRIVELHNRAQGAATRGTEGPLTSFMKEHLPGLYRAVLVTNPRVIASQFTSAFNYGAYASPEFIKDIKSGLSWENIQDTIELSDIAWSRFHMGHSSIELGEMARSDAALRAWTGKTSDINKLGWSLKISDAAALAAGMRIAQDEYQAHLKDKLKGFSAEWWADKPTDMPEINVKAWKEIEAKGEEAAPEEREAVIVWKKMVSRRAEFLWQRTQPSWDKWNRSMITSQSGLERILFLFRSFHEKSLTIFNEAKLEYDGSPKTLEDKTKFVQKTTPVLTGYTVNVAVRITLTALAGRKLPEGYEYLKGFLTSWMAMFPIFGRVLDGSTRRFLDAATDHKPQYRGLPIELFPLQIINTTLKAAPDFSQAMGEIVNGDTDAAKKAFERGINDLYIGIGAMVGFPVFEVKRVKAWLPKGKEEPSGRRTGRRGRSGR